LTEGNLSANIFEVHIKDWQITTEKLLLEKFQQMEKIDQAFQLAVLLSLVQKN